MVPSARQANPDAEIILRPDCDVPGSEVDPSEPDAPGLDD
jgi:hypothetical protein